MPTSSNSGMEGLHRQEQNASSRNAQKNTCMPLNAAVPFFVDSNRAAVPPACIHLAAIWDTAAAPPACTHSDIAAGMHSQRHCRQHALTAALPPACIHSGIAASMHSQRHCRQHAFTAALPPACIHSGIAASMHSQRHCRQHALPAAWPPHAALPPA